MQSNFIINSDLGGTGFNIASFLLSSLLLKTNCPGFQNKLGKEFGFEEVYRFAKINNAVMRFMISLLDEKEVMNYGKLNLVFMREKERIKRSIELINEISNDLDEAKAGYAIIKTLDNFPDFGEDVDVFINMPFCGLKSFIRKKYHLGIILKRKLSEVIRGKMEVSFAGSPPLCLHYKRFGPVGEHSLLAENIIKNRIVFDNGQVKTFAPSNEDRILIFIIHRIYRHFTFRAGDIITAAHILRDSRLNWDYIFSAARQMGIKKGLEYFLCLFENFHIRYCGRGLLPQAIINHLSCEGNIFFRDNLFRLPLNLLPRLFTSEFLSYLKFRKLDSAARLSVVPLLSLSALLSIKIFKKDLIGFW